jgi:hypothetical protein
MRSGWSSTQLPNASSQTTPGPASSVSALFPHRTARIRWLDGQRMIGKKCGRLDRNNREGRQGARRIRGGHAPARGFEQEDAERTKPGLQTPCVFVSSVPSCENVSRALSVETSGIRVCSCRFVVSQCRVSLNTPVQFHHRWRRLPSAAQPQPKQVTELSKPRITPIDTDQTGRSCTVKAVFLIRAIREIRGCPEKRGGGNAGRPASSKRMHAGRQHFQGL